jgi:hypothetical protein
MKRCPRCNQVFEDDSLRFCLEDGAALVADVPPTVASPTMVLPPAQNNSPTLRQAFSPDVQAPRNWQMPVGAHASPVTRKRSSLVWIVGLMAVLIIGLGLALAIMISRAGKKTNTAALTNSNVTPENQTNTRSSDNSQNSNEANSTTTNSGKGIGEVPEQTWRKALGRWKSQKTSFVLDLMEAGGGIEGRLVVAPDTWPTNITPGTIVFRSSLTGTESPQGNTIVGLFLQLPQGDDCPNLATPTKFGPDTLTLNAAGNQIVHRQTMAYYHSRTCQWSSKTNQETSTWVRAQ